MYWNQNTEQLSRLHTRDLILTALASTGTGTKALQTCPTRMNLNPTRNARY